MQFFKNTINQFISPLSPNVIMRVEFTEINKPPLNYDRGTLYSLFIYISKQEKPYTKISTCQGIIRNQRILLNPLVQIILFPSDGYITLNKNTK